MSFLNRNGQFTALTSSSHSRVTVSKVTAVTISNSSYAVNMVMCCECVVVVLVCVREKLMGGLDGKVQSGISFLLLHFLATYGRGLFVLFMSFLWRRPRTVGLDSN